MNSPRIASVLVAAACCATLAACNRSHVPTDAQLTQLLHSERSAPTDPNAPIDAQAVNCLRAWSGDAELSGTLPPNSTEDAAKKSCRERIDGWIADAARNPDTLSFDEVSAPPSVKRAVALLASHHNPAVARLPSAADAPPTAMTAQPGGPAFGPVDMSPSLSAADELQALCQKAKDVAASGNTTQSIARYAPFCDKRIEEMRARISSVQQSGNAQQAKVMNETSQRTLTVMRQLATQQAAPPATAPQPPVQRTAPPKP